MRRESVRRLEVLVEMRPYEPQDFEEMAYHVVLCERAEQRARYNDLRLFDPRAYRERLDKSMAVYHKRQASNPSYRAHPSAADAREMRRMWAAGAMVKDIAKAFRRTEGNVRRVLDGKSHADAGGPIRPALTGKRQHRVPCWARTPELVAAVAAASGSNRAVARALGTSHSLVGAIRRDLQTASARKERGDG